MVVFVIVEVSVVKIVIVVVIAVGTVNIRVVVIDRSYSSLCVESGVCLLDAEFFESLEDKVLYLVPCNVLFEDSVLIEVLIDDISAVL